MARRGPRVSRVPDFSTRRRQRAPGPSDLALLAVALMALFAASSAAWGAWADLSRVRGATERAQDELDAARAHARALQSRGGRAEDTLASRMVLTREAPPPRVLSDLTALLPADVRVVDLALDYGIRLELRLRLEARGTAAYDLFLKRLAESGRFSDVLPGDETRDAEVRATVRMTYSGEGAP